MDTVRTLTAADAAALDDFLSRHRDSSMFLRANARMAGLEDHGAPHQATYAALFDAAGRIVAVAGHCWNGILLMQAPQSAAVVARAAVEASGRQVTGLSGPLAHVLEARTALGLADAAMTLDGAEGLYAIDLTTFEVPAALADAVAACRAPRPHEYDRLREWRVAYDIETLGATASPEQRRRSNEFLDAQIVAGNVWVAIADGAPVSLSALNAALPDIVQLGGIYTPPALRGRGYAKAAVAATLVASRERGATRAVLFTGNPSAVRSYEAVGFRLIGDYALQLIGEV